MSSKEECPFLFLFVFNGRNKFSIGRILEGASKIRWYEGGVIER